jgi:hypothetical protein
MAEWRHIEKFVVTALGFERICFLNADVLEEINTV